MSIFAKCVPNRFFYNNWLQYINVYHYNTACACDSNSSVLTTIVSTPGLHRIVIRWDPGGIPKATRRRVAFGRVRVTIGLLRVSIVLSSGYQKQRMIPKTTRTLHEPSRRQHEGHTMVPMDTRTPHEYETSCDLRQVFWHAKDFGDRHEGTPEPQFSLPMATRWLPNVPKDTRSEPNLKKSIFVCPSGVNIGSVWRLH